MSAGTGSGKPSARHASCGTRGAHAASLCSGPECSGDCGLCPERLGGDGCDGHVVWHLVACGRRCGRKPDPEPDWVVRQRQYTWNDGSGRVSGTVSGAMFTGGFNETHYQGSFVLNLSGKRFTGSYTGKNKDTGGAISWAASTVVASPDRASTNGAAPPATTTTGTTPGARRRIAARRARDGRHRHGVFPQGRDARGRWLPLDKDTVLKPGDSLTTDADASIDDRLRQRRDGDVERPDRSTTSLSQEGGIFRTQLELKWGQIRAATPEGP